MTQICDFFYFIEHSMLQKIRRVLTLQSISMNFDMFNRWRFILHDLNEKY